MSDKLITNIGLEIHAELSTNTKIFCSCKNEFGSKPNTNVCPICLGLPGSLPSLNRKAVEYAIKMGKALNCRINMTFEMARKNYFYPDLPKAYQISQAGLPICENGYIDFLSEGQIKRVHIERIHIEEDAGKLVHSDEPDGETLIDYNRCGVPLIEIVTKPDLYSSVQAKDFLETIKTILSHLNICDCKMQEGSIRCDVNVSMHQSGQKLGTRVEMKNVNSFSGACSAIEYEQKRQLEMLSKGKEVSQETRRWNDSKGISEILRTKENANDYRYFPEPDIPQISLDDAFIDNIEVVSDDLPNIRAIRYFSDYGLAKSDAVYIASDEQLSSFFSRCIAIDPQLSVQYSNWIMGDVLKNLNRENVLLSDTALTAENITELIGLVNSGEISSTAARKVFDVIIKDNSRSPRQVAESLELMQISDVEFLSNLVGDVLSENEKSVSDYKSGKDNALKFLIGQCMKFSKGRANPEILSKLMLEKMFE